MLKGTVWHFNSTIDTTNIWNSLPFTNMDGLFTCDGVQYKQLMGEELIDEQGTKPGSIDYINPDSHDGEMAYIIDSDIGGNVGWQDESFRTITFINEPVANGSALEAWLNENAVISADPYASYVVTGTALLSIADAIRAKTGDSSELTFPTGFVDAIDGLTTLEQDTADATATAKDIILGKTAYVKGQKIYGSYVLNIANVQTNVTRTVTFIASPGLYMQGQYIMQYVRGAGEYWTINTINAHFICPDAYTNALTCTVDTSTPCKWIGVYAAQKFSIPYSGSVRFQLVYTAAAIVSTDN